MPASRRIQSRRHCKRQLVRQLPLYTHSNLRASSFLIWFERFNPHLCFRGKNPLHLSSQQGHMEVCQFLVSSKADVIAKENEYGNPTCTHMQIRDDLFFDFVFAKNNECDIHSYARIQTCGCDFFLFVLNVFIRVFLSVEGLHCIVLLKEVTWKCASFSSHPKQTSLQKTTSTSSTHMHPFESDFLLGFS